MDAAGIINLSGLAAGQATPTADNPPAADTADPEPEPDVLASQTDSGTRSAGRFHTCGLTADGTPVCWGSNDFGQASPPDDLALAVP